MKIRVPPYRGVGGTALPSFHRPNTGSMDSAPEASTESRVQPEGDRLNDERKRQVMGAAIQYVGKEKECIPGSMIPVISGENRLLSALPEAVYERLAPDLQQVRLDLGTVLHEAGEQLKYVYFPIDSIVSLLCELDDGASGEIAVAGNEGLVGIALLMGGKSTPHRAVVQCAGFALRIRADVLLREFERGGPLQKLLLRYTQALITQMAQTAMCN